MLLVVFDLRCVSIVICSLSHHFFILPTRMYMLIHFINILEMTLLLLDKLVLRHFYWPKLDLLAYVIN